MFAVQLCHAPYTTHSNELLCYATPPELLLLVMSWFGYAPPTLIIEKLIIFYINFLILEFFSILKNFFEYLRYDVLLVQFLPKSMHCPFYHYPLHYGYKKTNLPVHRESRRVLLQIQRSLRLQCQLGLRLQCQLLRFGGQRG